MPNHKKPTKEELDAIAQKALEDAEKLKNAPPSPSPSQAVPSPSPSQQAPSPSPSPASASPSPSQAVPSPSPSPDPYRKKAIEQGKQNIVLNGKIKKTNEAIDQAANIADPTEEEMRVEYPEWDEMSEPEKRSAIKAVKNDKRFALLNAARQEEKNIEAWNTKVETFVADPKTLTTYPALEGKIDDFILFAIQPSRVASSFELLVSAFLYDATKTMKPKKGEMFPTGANRSAVRQKPKSDKISLEEARHIREHDYKRWDSLRKAGKIDYTI